MQSGELKLMQPYPGGVNYSSPTQIPGNNGRMFNSEHGIHIVQYDGN